MSRFTFHRTAGTVGNDRTLTNINVSFLITKKYSVVHYFKLQSSHHIGKPVIFIGGFADVMISFWTYIIYIYIYSPIRSSLKL